VARRWTWINATSVLSENNLKRMQSVQGKDVVAREAVFHKLRTDRGFPALVRHGLNGLMLNSFEKAETVRLGYRNGEEWYLLCEDVVKGFEKVTIS
jgi:hypothetical protein